MAVYAISDLHGYYDIYEQVCEFINSEDTVYFLGDAGDRGPEGWKLIKAIYENSQWHYIKGNHEDMLVAAAKDWIKYSGESTMNIGLCYQNGGYDTLNEMIIEPNVGEWIKRIENLPIQLKYKNQMGLELIMCHAGFTPDYEYEPDEYDMIWDRNHIYWGCWDDTHFRDVIVIHGHTPALCLADNGIFEMDREYGAFEYCRGHKIDIDNGCFYTKGTVLFNLDTFEEIEFRVRKGE